MANQKAAGPQISEFFNGPRFTLKLPQQRSNMAATAKKPAAKTAVKANRKRKGGHRKHHRNPATSSAAPKTIIKYRAKPAVKANPATKANKRRKHRRNGAGTGFIARMRNGLGGKGIGGLQPGDLVGGAVGLLLDGAIQLFVPAGWIGLGIRGVGAIGMVRFLPRAIGPAAGLTAGAMVVKDGANRIFNISQLLNSTVTRFVPIQLAAVPATGMAGFGRGMNPMGVNFGGRIASGATRY